MDEQGKKERSRLVTWEDPFEVATAAKNLSGIEYLEQAIKGKNTPPIGQLLDFHLVQAGQGKATFTIKPEEYHYNPGNVVHGGVAATVLDAAMACAVHSLLPPKHFCTTIELKINYLRPITINTGLLSGEGEIIHFGGRTAVVQGKLLDINKKLYAYATATFMILDSSN